MKVFVVIPTYNERQNIATLINALVRFPKVHPLVVDDNSPDGTADVVRKLAQKNPRVHLVLRTKERGRGTAGIAGFKEALRRKADLIIEMDADLSHDPKYVPALINRLEECDVVLGSRQVRGGAQVGRPINRRLLTYFANFYIRTILGVPVRDCNSGFRGFRAHALQRIMRPALTARGPDIVQEVLYRAHLRGLRICEIPITFYERREGQSKLGLKQLWRGYTAVLKLKLEHLMGKI